MKIEVTQEDIDKGEKEDCVACPVALAISRATGFEALVTCSDVTFAGSDKELRLPESVSDFVNAFDNDEPVQPFSFELSLKEKG